MHTVWHIRGMQMAEDFRNKLIDRALALFGARGYDAVSVQEVVEAAGVTKPTLYHYFGSKRGLLDALLRERLSGLQQAVSSAAQYHGDLTLNLRRLAEAYFDFARRQPALYQFLLSTQYAPQRSEAYQAASERHEQLLETVMRLFEEALPHMQGRQRGYALSFIGTLNTYITLALNGHVALDDALLYSVVHQFMHGIFS